MPERIRAEGPEDHNIVVYDENICPDCANRNYCRKARRDVTDCQNFLRR